jgi:hypothetical protein
MQSSTSPSPPRRRFWRFSLRAILVAMIVLGLVAAWFGRELDRARRQEDVIQKLKAEGMSVGYDFDREKSKSLRFNGPRLPAANSLLRTVLRQDRFGHADRAMWSHKPGTHVDPTLALLPQLPRLTALQLRNIPVTEQSLALIARNQHLAELDLSKTPGLTAAGLAELTNAGELATLSLRGPEVTDETVRGLADLTQLQDVSLVVTSVTTDGLAPLRKLHNLKALEIYECPAIDDQLFTHLEPHKQQLEMLGLYQSSLTDAGMVHIGEMRQLRWLALYDAQISDAGLAQLSELKELEELSLPRSKITDAGLHHIARLPKLKWLSLPGSSISKQGLEELARLPKLEMLSLWDIPLTDDDIMPLKSFPSLKEVNVGPRVTKASSQKLQQQMPRCSFRGDDPNGVNTFSLPALQK